ncbi:MAG TPA: GMC family oxidoreductase [Polyangiaceae bacterium]|nr:GMC family oxidoreductase [Polyangiaceae bacterium]
MNSSERVVVVGTGPAAAAAAVVLSDAGQNPLLLEAGSGSTPLGLTARIRGLTLAKVRPSLTRRSDLTMLGDPRAELYEKLAPGGLSNHWACAVPRFSPDDFADAARAGEQYTWPLGYDELAPWYDRIEPLLHIAGAPGDVPSLPAGRFRDRWSLAPEWEHVAHEVSARGRDLVAMPYAYGSETILTRAATAFNAYTRLIKPILRPDGSSIRYGTRVESLECSNMERRVVAVHCRDARTSAELRIPCRAVVLAAGAVNSAQILLESRSPEFPEGLGNRHDVLGRYLHDHPLAKIVVDLGRRVSLAPASYVTRPSLTRSEPLYAAACMQWNSASHMARTVLSGHPGQTSRLGFSIFGTMIPTPEDRIAIARRARGGERSPLQFSLTYPERAEHELERAKDELLACLERAGWAPRLRVFHVEVPGNSVHYGGTCRMHESPRLGVVDAFCRVHGAPNVVVADSSVFTTGPEKNPVLTAMALAARASDRLDQDLRTFAV